MVFEENLYIALLGGKHEKANVEVHDVIPFISSDLSSAYSYLKEQWFGLKKGVHIDAWMKIDGVSYQSQDFKIQICDKPSEKSLHKLYLINLGAYVPDQFGEVHKYLIVAGLNKADAKAQGKLAVESHWFKAHTDAVIDVDDCLELNQINQKYIQLVEGAYTENTFKNDYILI